MTRFRNDYAPDWAEVARVAKLLAGHRCVRCLHPFTPDGHPMPCDEACDPTRGRLVRADRFRVDKPHDFQTPGLNYTTHHLDGDKANNRWWNLLPTCNACHLHVQAVVIPEQGYQWPHSAWFLPFVAGYYAFAYGGLETTREQVLADLDRFLAFGQPHLYGERAADVAEASV